MASYKEPGDASTLVTSPLAPSTQVSTYDLTVIEGPDRGATMRVVGGAPAPLLVGTGPACELRLTDPEVSRRHVSLEAVGRALRITDLSSTNGTFVNGLRVIAAELAGGETVRIGSSSIEIELVEADRVVPLSEATSFGRLLGASVEMKRLYPLLERLAATDVSIVIEGETGTGKEVLAESIHAMSARRAGPFMVFDCTAVPPNLVEAELFGHERGAFTGAVASRKGIFEQADGGTLLIDEIGDLDPSLQPKLLRALQRGEFRRVGGERSISVDVRILAATRRDLDREVQEGRFRDDLFFRLAITRVELPPLRRRRGDIAVLARAFWKELGGEGAVPYAQLAQWETYDWPGNVRQLRNEVARRVALGELFQMDNRAPLPTTRVTGDPIQALLERDLPFGPSRQLAVAEFERRYIERIVEQHGGNVSHAAAASGLALRYFQLLRARHSR